MTVQDVYDFLRTLAPEELAMSWDHVGLLCGRSDREVHRVLVALDPFLPVCQEAHALGCELIVTHHAALWELKAVNNFSAEGRRLLYLIEHGMSALNAHTNLDLVSGGVNDVLASTLGLKNVQILDPMGTDAQGRPYGLVRYGEMDPMEPEALCRFVKERLHCQGLRWVSGGKPIVRVAVGGGSCGSELSRVAAVGCDAFVTADVNYNCFVDAMDLGVSLYDAGHFETENPICAVLAKKLQAQFPELEIFQSKIHKDCINFA